MTTRTIASLYSEVHNQMRNIDGLQPQEAFNELLKFLYVKQSCESEKVNFHNVNESYLREKLTALISTKDLWLSEIWRDKSFHLSDNCLGKVNTLFRDTEISKINFDIRSEAIKEFLTPQIRKGLGIFLTPDVVVKSILEFVNPVEGSTIFDPACGSGTFLLQAQKLFPERNLKFYGVDKNPRMLLLSYLNLGITKSIKYKKELNDSLFPDSTEILKKNTYDYIFTNPPFGVWLDGRANDLSLFETSKDQMGFPLHKQCSEIVFVERCLDLLKPGGTLAIVIPKSIATNNSLELQRLRLSEKGYIYSILSLPPETFAIAGAQTTTIVLFIKKYKNEEEKNEKCQITLSIVDNIGFDTTGRSKAGSQLEFVTKNDSLVRKSKKNHDFTEFFDSYRKHETFNKLSRIFIKETTKRTVRLKDICLEISTGRTPARNAYSDIGVFLVKVGNLTGFGINWDARERNYIKTEDFKKRRIKYTLKKGDILLTSSAHSPIYIAKKVDIIDAIPSWIGEDVSFVGEVMLIRPDTTKIDPYTLLAFLRAPSTMSEIQKMVRGQTAHLGADDIGELSIPKDLESNESVKELAILLKRQSVINLELNNIINKQTNLLSVL